MGLHPDLHVFPSLPLIRASTDVSRCLSQGITSEILLTDLEALVSSSFDLGVVAPLLLFGDVLLVVGTGHDRNVSALRRVHGRDRSRHLGRGSAVSGDATNRIHVQISALGGVAINAGSSRRRLPAIAVARCPISPWNVNPVIPTLQGIKLLAAQRDRDNVLRRLRVGDDDGWLTVQRCRVTGAKVPTPVICQILVLGLWRHESSPVE